jgi:hypothetical protein
MKLCLTALYIFYIIFLAYIQHNWDVSLETKTVHWHCCGYGWTFCWLLHCSDSLVQHSNIEQYFHTGVKELKINESVLMKARA